ncbi:MXAN_6577-like cysteine-rich protein [Sorangium sp. So ce295]|uniref:MXAN_6577-like cysteine-rich protein n=1 Tax=Sorangium sp. So ce295 TaxID=3133295 RepID=UPI003F633990
MNRSGLRLRPALSSAALLLAAGVVLAASCAESPDVSSECPDGLSRCNGECVELEANADHCGACGDACEAGQLCVKGRCSGGGGEGGGGEGGGIGTGVGGGEACGEGQSDCSGKCVNLETDLRNCGDCDVECAEGHVCADGSCACAGDLTACEGACVDVLSDRRNCGECESSCAPAQQCVDGVCTCPAGLAACDGACADLQTSQLHCGACGVACERGAVCQAGACTCVLGTYDELSDTFPQRVTGTTISGETNYDLACVAASSSERVYRFTPSEAGTYTLDTVGSTFDTAIGVLGATTCAQLACNDDIATGVAQSRVRAVLEAGQQVLIVVTGFDGGEGDFTLNMTKADPPKCPGGAIDAALPATVTGNTEHSGDAIRPTCGAADSPDASYMFTAPAAGKYVFDTFGSGFNTILELHDGACDGDVLTCSDDAGEGSQSRATVELRAGQTVVAVIDGFEGARGPYTLNVDAWAPPACPMMDLGSAYPQTITGRTSGRDGVLQPPPDCATGNSPEVSYSFTAPIAGRYTFDTNGSTFDTVLHVHDGSCTGALLGCSNDAESLSSQSQVSTPLAQGQTAYVVVDGASGKHGAYTLNVSGTPGPPCPEKALESVVPQTVSGTTAGAGDYVSAPCGVPGGEDRAYSFTAPADGLYVFDTLGSSFDTLVHVHAGTCGGAVLGCNDNAAGVQSRVVVPLAAGQETVVVVDGASAKPQAAGEFELNISLFQGDGICGNPVDLGSTVPQTTSGSTLFQPNSGTPSCVPSSGNDRVYRFTAPADGTYVIDTLSSNFDTVLHVHDGDSCSGPELACNDNAVMASSRVTVTLTEGQVITIIGDSRRSSSGNLTLNIAAVP